MVRNANQNSWYHKNKELALEKQRQYRLLHRKKILENRRKYDKENKERQLQLKREWRLENKERIKEQKRKDDKKYYDIHKIELQKKRKITRVIYYQKNKEKIAIRQKIHAQLPEVKARRNLMARLRRRLNPQSNRSDSLELQFAKNRVRLRDGNRCQWQGCNITHKEDHIHVHHIFPRSEHPELELVEAYMICYCSIHHRQFHRMRGDSYSEMIKPDTNNTLELNSVRGRD